MVHARRTEVTTARDESVPDEVVPPAESPGTAATTADERAAEPSDTEGAPGGDDASDRHVRAPTDGSGVSVSDGDDADGDKAGDVTAMDATSRTLNEFAESSDEEDEEVELVVVRDRVSGMLVLNPQNRHVFISEAGTPVLRIAVNVFPMPVEIATCDEVRKMSEEATKGMVGVPCPACPPAFRNTSIIGWKNATTKKPHDVDFQKKVRCEASPNLSFTFPRPPIVPRRTAAFRVSGRVHVSRLMVVRGASLARTHTDTRDQMPHVGSLQAVEAVRRRPCSVLLLLLPRLLRVAPPPDPRAHSTAGRNTEKHMTPPWRHWSTRPGAVSLLCCAVSPSPGGGLLAEERRLGNGAGSSV